MQPRTKRQREVLSFIKEFIEKHGYEPSYQQIARELKVSSKGGIAKHIEALERQGLILRQHENGSFKLVLNPGNRIEEFVAEVEWIENPTAKKMQFENENLFVPKFLLGGLPAVNMRALLIQNDAMIDRQILEDDIALIELKTFARDGECVAALIENKTVVLRNHYRSGANIELVPANEKYDIIKHSADEITIIGIYRGLLRPNPI